MRQWIFVGLLAVAPVIAAGCQKTFRASVSQPNPLEQPTETLRTSENITIITGDMELRMPSQRQRGAAAIAQSSARYPLQNVASFTVVSRDRLRFHVQVEHKWPEWADLSSWRAYLVDDKGRRYEPEEIDPRAPRHLVTMWDNETRGTIRNRFGDVVGVRRDRHKHRRTMGSLSIFRGNGDVVFYGRDIFTPEVKRLTLVIERRTLAFSWTWTFADDPYGPPNGSGEVHYLEGPPGF